MGLTLHVGSGTTAGPLTLFPVWTDAPLAPQRRYVTTGAVVAELPDGATVGALRVTNPRHRPLLVCEGTVLEGGWQHRAVAESVIVAAGASATVPVVCVEAGRWGGQGGHGGGRRRVPSAVRGGLRGLTAVQAERVDRQSDVWGRVAGYQERHGRTATGSLVDVQRSLDDRVAQVLAGTAPLPAQRGVVVAAGGHPVLLEVFDHPDTLGTHWRSILASVALDVLDVAPVPTPAWRARAFAAAAGRPGPLADVRVLTDPDDASRVAHLVAVNAHHRLVLAV